MKLKDIGTIITGNTPSKKNNEYYESDDILFVKPSDIEENYITSICKSEEYISEKARNKARILPEGSVLVTCIGTIGKVGILKKEASCNQQINAIIPNEKVNSKYLAYLIQSKQKILQFKANAPVVPIINKTDFSEIEIKICDIKQQQEIVRQLDSIKKIIDIRKKQKEELNKLIKSKFVKMFGDIKDTKYNVVKLEELTNLITDGEHKKPNYTERGKPFISVLNITTGELKFNNCKFVSDEDSLKFQKRCKPERNDILYTKVGTYGRSAIVNTDREFSLYVSVCLIKPKSELINPIFLNYTMKQPYVKAQADKCIKGIGVPDLHLIEIKKFNIILPPIEIQNQFAKIVEQTDKQKFEIEKSQKKVEDLYNALIEKYF